MLVRKIIPPVLFGISLLLSGCNFGATPAPTQDINAINTSIVGTTVAQLSSQMTGTALALPSATSAPTEALPTFALPTAGGDASPTAAGLPTVSFNTTPLPGFTPLASPTQAGPTASLGDECNNSAFEGDVTIRDGTILKPGEDFTKIWAIRNTGSCQWDEGFALVFVGGDTALDPYNYEFKKTSDIVLPGQGVNIGIKLTAPLAEGDYQGHWRMRNDKGYYFGTYLSVYITVQK
jgi:hypothetical protein